MAEGLSSLTYQKTWRHVLDVQIGVKLGVSF
jgi:hypothetical protein